MTVAYLGLGANLGDARQTLKDAVVCLAQQPGITVLAKSSLYRSAPVEADGDDFHNCVVAIGTTLDARTLLRCCLDLENQFGRERPYPNAPRTLDIDLLLFGDEVIEEADLSVPHPRLTRRAFTLLPLTELDADVVVPGWGRASDYLPQVADQAIEKVMVCQCPLHIARGTPNAPRA